MALSDLLLSDLHSTSSLTLLLAFISTVLCFYILRPSAPKIPYINRYPNDFFLARAKRAFLADSTALLAAGTAKYGVRGQPFGIFTTLGPRIILPAAWLDWVAQHPDLDHQAAVAAEFFGDFPGFEAIGAFNDPNAFVTELVKRRMSRMTPEILGTLQAAVADVLEEEEWCHDGAADDSSFRPIAWARLSTALVARMSASVFAGPHLAKSAEWQTLTQSYTANLFMACRALRAWPAPLRRLVVWFLPECRVCREQIARAREFVTAERHRRAGLSKEQKDAEGVDAFDWMDPRADAAVIQLALAAGAIHTTSQLLNQALLDLAYHASAAAGSRNADVDTGLIAQLRAEVSLNASSPEGICVFRPVTLPKLSLLEACIKETQRLKPQTLVNLDRLTLQAVTLPNGARLPQGTMVSISSAPMWEAAHWGADASMWDPKRWLAADESSTTGGLPAGDKLVNSSLRHFAFGKGRFICPGRFMVNAEVKIALAMILRDWNVRLSEESFAKVRANGKGRVDWVPFGFEMLADESVGVEVRRRTSKMD